MFWKRDVSKLNEQQQNLEEAKEQINDEEWITVEGYKGVNSDLTGYGNYQFNLHQRHIIRGDIEECSNGFHFCKTLKDVFGYYNVFTRYPSLSNNRYFKVSAVVKKSDWECLNKDKFVAKEIYLIEEISQESSFFHESMIGLCFDVQTYVLHLNNYAIKTVQITDTNMASDILNDFNKFEKLIQEELRDESMKILKDSKERLFNAFTDNKLSELFFNIIVSDDITKNNAIAELTVALGTEGVSKDMLVYHILKATKFSEGFN